MCLFQNIVKVVSLVDSLVVFETRILFEWPVSEQWCRKIGLSGSKTFSSVLEGKKH